MAMNNDWFSCDGHGHERALEIPRPDLQAPTWSVSRRNLLTAASIGLVGWLGHRSALAQMAVRPDGQNGNVLVVLFLRGGADGLSFVVPYEEDNYYRKRPNIAVPPPSRTDLPENMRAADLDGFFGLSPQLRPLLPLYKEGKLLAVHACGSQDRTRSHFEAMSTMERGLAIDSGPSTGWVARHLAATEGRDDSPLRAVAFGGVMPDSLRGATHAAALASLDQFRLQPGKTDEVVATERLRKLYAVGKDEVSIAGKETLSVLKTLRKLEPAKYQPQGGAAYPDTPLGRGFKQTAILVRANVGMEIACLDGGGWDTHVGQGSTILPNGNLGVLAGLIDDLGKSLAAFHTDMGSEMRRVTVVVMTEFGRRVHENGGLGTDHGRASTLFLMGAGVKGGRVIAKWRGLEEKFLDDVGDITPTTDYRDVVGEVLAHRFPSASLDAAFAGYRPKFLGVMG